MRKIAGLLILAMFLALGLSARAQVNCYLDIDYFSQQPVNTSKIVITPTGYQIYNGGILLGKPLPPYTPANCPTLASGVLTNALLTPGYTYGMTNGDGYLGVSFTIPTNATSPCNLALLIPPNTNYLTGYPPYSPPLDAGTNVVLTTNPTNGHVLVNSTATGGSSTNGLATTNWVWQSFYPTSNPSLFVTASITNGLATTNFVNGATVASSSYSTTSGNAAYATNAFYAGDVYAGSNNVFSVNVSSDNSKMQISFGDGTNFFNQSSPFLINTNIGGIISAPSFIDLGTNYVITAAYNVFASQPNSTCSNIWSFTSPDGMNWSTHLVPLTVPNSSGYARYYVPRPWTNSVTGRWGLTLNICTNNNSIYSPYIFLENDNSGTNYSVGRQMNVIGPDTNTWDFMMSPMVGGTNWLCVWANGSSRKVFLGITSDFTNIVEVANNNVFGWPATFEDPQYVHMGTNWNRIYLLGINRSEYAVDNFSSDASFYSNPTNGWGQPYVLNISGAEASFYVMNQRLLDLTKYSIGGTSQFDRHVLGALNAPMVNAGGIKASNVVASALSVTLENGNQSEFENYAAIPLQYSTSGFVSGYSVSDEILHSSVGLTIGIGFATNAADEFSYELSGGGNYNTYSGASMLDWHDYYDNDQIAVAATEATYETNSGTVVKAFTANPASGYSNTEYTATSFNGSFTGSGSGLTNLNPANIVGDIVPNTNQVGNVFANLIQPSGAQAINPIGFVQADAGNSILGTTLDGSGLTNIPLTGLQTLPLTTIPVTATNLFARTNDTWWDVNGAARNATNNLPNGAFTSNPLTTIPATATNIFALSTNATLTGVTIYGDANKTNWMTYNSSGDSRTNSGSQIGRTVSLTKGTETYNGTNGNATYVAYNPSNNAVTFTGNGSGLTNFPIQAGVLTNGSYILTGPYFVSFVANAAIPSGVTYKTIGGSGSGSITTGTTQAGFVGILTNVTESLINGTADIGSTTNITINVYINTAVSAACQLVGGTARINNLASTNSGTWSLSNNSMTNLFTWGVSNSAASSTIAGCYLNITYNVLVPTPK